MNKNVLIILIMILVILAMIYLVSCSNTEEIQGINIFDKNKNYITDYIPKNKIGLSELVDGDIKGKISVITESGSVNSVSTNTYLDTDRNSVIAIDDSRVIKEVKGIYISENQYRIGDAYHESKEHLDKGDKVMVVLLDGFSYDQYKKLDKENSIPFFSKHFRNEAISVYTPVTNAGFAAMITGERPDINGIHNREYRQMKVESIFGYGEKNAKRSILLEADIKILNTEIEPILHLDDNKDGDIDDEIFETALEISKDNYDFIFIHFHGIDDRGHSYGPDSNITMDYIKKIDRYMEKISNVWKDAIILTSDHGMREIDEGGNHGICRYEDMLVPYFKKEKANE